MSFIQAFSLFSTNSTQPDSYPLDTPRGVEMLILMIILAVGGTLGSVWGYYRMCCKKEEALPDELAYVAAP